jgi:hypothetical protein
MRQTQLQCVRFRSSGSCVAGAAFLQERRVATSTIRHAALQPTYVQGAYQPRFPSSVSTLSRTLTGRRRGAQGPLSTCPHTSSLVSFNPGAAELSGSRSLTHSLTHVNHLVCQLNANPDLKVTKPLTCRNRASHASQAAAPGLKLNRSAASSSSASSTPAASAAARCSRSLGALRCGITSSTSAQAKQAVSQTSRNRRMYSSAKARVQPGHGA